jgi:hypothetical protein
MSLSTTSQQTPLLESSYKQHVPSARATPSHVDGTLQKVPCMSQGKVRRSVSHVMLCIGKVISSRLLKGCLLSNNGIRRIKKDMPNASALQICSNSASHTCTVCHTHTQTCMHACAHACLYVVCTSRAATCMSLPSNCCHKHRLP